MGQHIRSVHHGLEHRYNKPKTKQERMQIHYLRTTLVALTVHPELLDHLQVRLSCLSVSGDKFIPDLDMLTSDTVADLIKAILDRPEFVLDDHHRRPARLVLEDGRDLHEIDQQSL